MILEWKRIVEIEEKENVQKWKKMAKNGVAKNFEDFYRWMENSVADFGMKENGKNWIRKIKVILSLKKLRFLLVRGKFRGWFSDERKLQILKK